MVCSSQGSLILLCGCSLDHFGISNADKFCKFIVALKTLASNQTVIEVEMEGNKTLVFGCSRFMTCIITTRISASQRHDVVFEALQIAHLFDLLYSAEIDVLMDQELSSAAAAAEMYSASTEIKVSANCDGRGKFYGSSIFADFALHYVEKLLSHPHLCSEWALPLASADGIIKCKLVDNEGSTLFDLPAKISETQHLSDALTLHNSKAIVVSHALDLMKTARELSFSAHQKGCCQVLSLGSAISSCLWPILFGPLGRSLCLVIYFSSCTHQSHAASKLIDARQCFDNPPGASPRIRKCLLSTISNILLQECCLTRIKLCGLLLIA